MEFFGEYEYAIMFFTFVAVCGPIALGIAIAFMKAGITGSPHGSVKKYLLPPVDADSKS